MRVVVTGGREYGDYEHLDNVLTELDRTVGISLIGHGACRDGGADIMAERWAKEHEVPYMGIPARWKRGSRGKGEGPIRNGLMLQLIKPDMVIAFPGGNGTANCVLQAHKLGITVQEA